MSFAEQVVAITGAASGIGQELCRSFARRGARIGLLDRDQGSLGALAEELGRSGVRCCVAAVDVGQREQVQDAIQKICGELGPIDVAIPCAGICRPSTVDDLKVPELEEIVRTNFFGTVYMIEAVVPSMLERKRGKIAGISSLAGVRGIPFEPGYSASKAAVAAYLESLRSELRHRGIAVTTIFPGYVQSPLLDEINVLMGADMSNGKAFTPVAAAERIVRALERGSAYEYFPSAIGVGVRVSRLLPPRLYDLVISRMFRRFPLSRSHSLSRA